MRSVHVVAIALLVAGGVVASSGTAVARADPPPRVTGLPSTITIGDSVMLGARWVLRKRGVAVVDAKESRQAYTAPGLMKRRGARLQSNVVVHLGTNGSFSTSICKDIMLAAGPARRVFMVTIAVPRSWERRNNALIRRCAASSPGRTFLIDWHRVAARHPKWLYSDHVHLRPTGAKGYARMIAHAVKSAS